MFRTFMVPVALVSLIDRLVACSARIAADKWTHAQTKHCNPCCAYVPRVKCLEMFGVCVLSFALFFLKSQEPTGERPTSKGKI